jgi:hypothetical protein
MDFLKKHYEKALLGVVLLGLAVAVGFLPFKITSDKQELEDKRNKLIHPNVKPLTNLNLTAPELVLKKLSTPLAVDFSPPHKLFNPMPWQKAVDGRLIEVNATNLGPNALVVTKQTPLYLVITLDEVSVTDAGAERFRVGVLNEASTNRVDWTKRQKYCKVGDTNEVFAVRSFRAPPDSPTNATVTLELNSPAKSGDGRRERIEVSRDKPFKRVGGYMLDLKYPPESKTFQAGRRVGNLLSFNGEDYNIFAITETKLVLSAKSNGQTWPVEYKVTTGP